MHKDKLLKTKELSPQFKQADSQAVTGGLYRTPEPVHRGLADPRLLAIPPSRRSSCRKRSELRERFIIGF